jgi:UPF0755 protein
VANLKKIFIRLALGAGVLIGLFVGWILFVGLSSVELEEPTTLTIERGATLGVAATTLADNSIIHDARSFQLLARFFGMGSDIKAGKYEFKDGVSGFQVLQKIYRGYFAKNRLRIQEGWTFTDLRKALDDHDAILHSSAGWSQNKILDYLNISYEHPEGLFFPDTYIFSGGTSDLEMLKISHEKMNQVLEQEWRKRNIKVRFKDPYNALILASIIEKETSLVIEKPIISGVFMNRLKTGMRLQADPTVIYGLGDNFDGDIRYKDLKTDNPYNTYTRNGLPPSPIALPSRSSIHAALNPAETSSLYFVAKGNGRHQFSDNLRDHNRAVRKYQR